MSRSKVVAGDYKRQPVGLSFGSPHVTLPGPRFLKINKDTVKSVSQVNSREEFSTLDAVASSYVASSLLGAPGIWAGAAARTGMNLICINWNDGKRSLLDVDDKVLRAILIHTF